MTSKLVVWDVDGTLVDSRQTIFDSMQRAFAEAGLPLPSYEAVRQVVGLGLREGIEVLLPNAGPEQLDRATDAYRAAFGAKVNQPCMRMIVCTPRRLLPVAMAIFQPAARSRSRVSAAPS